MPVGCLAANKLGFMFGVFIGGTFVAADIIDKSIHGSVLTSLTSKFSSVEEDFVGSISPSSGK